MKAISDTRPKEFVKSQGKTQVNYNITETTTETVSGGSRTSYEYDFVEIEGEFTKSKVISALLFEDYNTDDQIAILANNATVGKPTEEFINFQTKRTSVKAIADKIVYDQIGKVIPKKL